MCGINYLTNVNNFCSAQRLHMNMNPVKVVGFIPDNIKTELKEAKEIQGCRDSIIIQVMAEYHRKESREFTIKTTLLLKH